MTSKQLKNTPLHELKRIALEDLKVTKDQVREYGHLSYRQTWIDAILDIRDGIKQLTISDVPPSFSEEPDSPEPENVRKTDITNDCHLAIELGWASSLSAPHICNDIAEIVSPLRVILLSATHKRFKAWQPWMDIDRQFTFFNGSRHTILYFDVWGYCHTLEENASHSTAFDLAALAKYGTPIPLEKTVQFKAATSNELEVAASKDGFLHQGSKVNSFACPDVADVEATPLDDYLIIEGESSQPTEPEIINITPEEYPEIWEILQPPKVEKKQENHTIDLTTYEVIQSSPEPDLYTFESSPESRSSTAPKFPLEDFLKALFLGPQVLVPNQSA